MPDSNCFQIKGGLVPLTILELFHYDYQSFTQQMAAKVEQAPDFFQHTPVIIALEKLDESQDYIDFIELCQLCNEFGIVPVAIRGGSETIVMAADVAGLAKLPAQKERTQRAAEPASLEPQQDKAELQPDAAKSQPEKAEPEPETAEPEGNEAEVESPMAATNKVVRHPVRSGQQIYAKGGDLIVLAPVSAGAEILADGNIHIYAPLRGRALAGVQGNEEAMIFCQSLEAELISIAGRYKVHEDLQDGIWKKAAKIELKENQLTVQEIG